MKKKQIDAVRQILKAGNAQNSFVVYDEEFGAYWICNGHIIITIYTEFTEELPELINKRQTKEQSIQFCKNFMRDYDADVYRDVYETPDFATCDAAIKVLTGRERSRSVLYHMDFHEAPVVSARYLRVLWKLFGKEMEMRFKGWIDPLKITGSGMVGLFLPISTKDREWSGFKAA